MLKIGIVGYGKMGRLRHERVERLGRGKVIAVCDPYAKPEVESSDIKVYGNWEDLLWQTLRFKRSL